MTSVVEWFSAVAAIPGMVWLQQICFGLVTGSVFVLLSLGLTIILGLMRILNFAHGAFYMLGAYLGWVVINLTGNFWLALLIIPVIGWGLGMLTEMFLLRPTYSKKEGEFLALLVTFGLFFATPDLMRWIFGNLGLPYPKVLSKPLFSLGVICFSQYRVFLILVTAILCVALWGLLQKSNLGMIIRAGISNPKMVEALGIEVRKTWTITFALGVSIAAFAGVLVGPIFAVQPSMGADILIQCFIVVVIGGLGSFWGAVLSGLLVGQILTVIPLLPDCTGLAGVLLFALAAFVLLTKPHGLLGTETAIEE